MRLGLNPLAILRAIDPVELDILNNVIERAARIKKIEDNNLAVEVAEKVAKIFA